MNRSERDEYYGVVGGCLDGRLIGIEGRVNGGDDGSPRLLLCTLLNAATYTSLLHPLDWRVISHDSLMGKGGNG